MKAHSDVSAPRALKLGDFMFIQLLALKNLLSFRNLTSLALQELNIVIRPNGAGKSNLIDAISLLQALPNNPNNFLASRGGPKDWIWRGRPGPDGPARLRRYERSPNDGHNQCD
jgi:predicted ATPase